MAFDLAGALSAGASYGQIADYLANKHGYDIKGAREAGFDDRGLMLHLLNSDTEPSQKTGLLANAKEAFVKAGQDVSRAAHLPFSNDAEIKTQYSADKDTLAARNVKTRGISDISDAFKEGPISGLASIPGVVADNLGQSAPYMAAMIAGGRTGAMAGGALGSAVPVVGNAVGAIGGAALGAGLGVLGVYTGSNVARQLDEHPDAPIDRTAALGAGVGQSMLDVASGGIGLGGFAKRLVGLPIKAAEEELIRASKRSLLTNVGVGAVRDAATEIPTEIAQQVLERHQAGLELLSDDAMKEYKDVGLTAGLLSGVVGSVAGGTEGSYAKSELARLNTEKRHQVSVDAQQTAAGINARQTFTDDALNNIDQTQAREADYAGLASVPTQDTVNQEIDANNYVNQTPTSATVAPQQTKLDLMNGLLATQKGTQEIISNMKVYFPELYGGANKAEKAALSERRDGVQSELLQRRNLFTQGTTPEPIAAVDTTQQGVTQQEVESAFNNKKYPKIITPETLDELGLTPKMKATVQDLIGQNVTSAKVYAKLGDIANNPKWTKEGVATNIENFLTQAQASKIKPKVSKLQEVLNAQVQDSSTITPDNGVDPRGNEPSIQPADAGGANLTSNPQQVDGTPVGNDTGSIGGIDERAKTSISALNAEPIDQTWEALSDVPYAELSKVQQTQIRQAKTDGYLSQLEADRIVSLGRKQFAPNPIDEPANPSDEHLYSKAVQPDGITEPSIAPNTATDTTSTSVERSTAQETTDAIRAAFANPKFANDRIVVEQSAPAGKENVQGEYDGRTATLYADNIPKGKEIGVFLHEVGVHMGLERVLGHARIEQLSNVINRMAESGKPNEKKLAKKALSRVTEAGDNAKTSDVANQEVIAYFVEEAVNAGYTPYTEINNQNRNIVSWLRNLWAGIANTVRKLGMDPNSISPDDIVALAYGAARIQGWEGATSIDTSTKPTEPLTSKAPIGRAYINPDDLPTNEILNPVEPTRVESIKAKLANSSTWDSYANKLLGPGTTFYNQSMKLYGADKFTNDDTNKDFGIYAFFRAQQHRNLMSNVLPKGYMYFDDQGVPKVEETEANGAKLLDWEKQFLVDYVQQYPDKYDHDTEAKLAIKCMVLADRYKELQSQGILSDTEFNQSEYNFGKELQKRYPTQYNEIMSTWTAMRTPAIEANVASGAMTRGKANEFISRSEYVPMYRVQQEENQSDTQYYQGILRGRAEQRIKGSDKQVDNVISNMLGNLEWLYTRAIKANAANLVADQLVAMNKLDPNTGGHWTNKPAALEDGIITIYRDGNPKNFKVIDPNVAQTFAAFPVMGSFTFDMARKATGYLRRGITLLPQFFVRQVWLDTQRLYLMTGSQVGLISTFGKVVSNLANNVISESETGKKLASYGIVGQIDTLDNDNTWYEKAQGTPKNIIQKAIFGMERLARASDLSARAFIFDEAKKRGATDNQAAMESLLYLNYQNKGTSKALNFLTALVPFVNTAIQGEWRTFESLRGNIPGVSKAHAKKQLMTRLAMYASLTAMYAMAKAGDDDYENQTEESKNVNYFFNMGGVPIKIPVPNEYLFLKIGMERLSRNLFTEMTDDDATLKSAFKQAFFAVIVTPSDVTPTFIKPLLEGVTNHSFYGDRPLVGADLLGQDANQQFSTNTSEFAKQISNAMYGDGMLNVNISPIKIDNFLRGVLGGGAQLISETSNYMLADRPELRLNEMPGVGGMFYNEEASGDKQRFYDLREKVTSKYNTWKKMLAENPQEAAAYREEHKDLINAHGQINAITTQLTASRNQYKQVLASAISREDKATRRSEILKREKVILQRVGDLRKQLL